MVKVLTTGFMLRRALAGLGRMVSGRGLGAEEAEVSVVEPPPGM